MVTTCAFSLVVTAVLLALLPAHLPPHLFVAPVTARSNHRHHARQIGGIAAAPAIFVAIVTSGLLFSIPVSPAVLAAFALLWATGVVDDIRDLPALPKLGLQLVGAAIAAWGIADGQPMLGLIFALIVLWLVGFTNVVNFMDGLDLMTVAGLLPGLAFVAVLPIVSSADPASGLLGAAGAGALIAFSRSNRPPALIFLGDSGSLGFGLLTGAAATGVALSVSPVVAALPFLYYLLDTATTLAQRVARGENILSAHSRHAYQIARRNGLLPGRISAEVAALNTGLSLLGLALAWAPSLPVQILALLSGTVAASLLIWRFRSVRPSPALGD